MNEDDKTSPIKRNYFPPKITKVALAAQGVMLTGCKFGGATGQGADGCVPSGFPCLDTFTS